MVKYPETNILVSPLDIMSKLEDVKTYLEINGLAYHQNSYNPRRKEFHYFMGDSVVFVKELLEKADIKIISSNEDSLSSMKSNIEDILKNGLII